MSGRRDPRLKPSERWAIFRNTHLQSPRWLFTAVVSDTEFDEVLGRVARTRRRTVTRILRRAVWLWPRIDEARGWAQADTGIAWGPENYLHEYRTRLVSKINEIVPKDASLIELGCNCGSDMHILHMDGYTHLTGVDAGGKALDLFAREYPDTYDLAQPQNDLFQRYLMNLPTGACDFVYSNGATIELVHPSFPIVREICRVARKGVLLDLSERGHSYPRDYAGQFARCGFAMVFNDHEEDITDMSSLVVFLRDA